MKKIIQITSLFWIIFLSSLSGLQAQANLVKMSSIPISRCNFYYTDPSGDGLYENNLDITQTITTAYTNSFKGYFVEFAVAVGDKLYIYDGPDVNSPLIGTYTGTNTPPNFITTGNKVTFRFTTNSSGVNLGFKIYLKCRTCPGNEKPDNPGSPCAMQTIEPFCTGIGSYSNTFSSNTTSQNAVQFFGGLTSVACLGSINHASQWYYFRIAEIGNLLMEIAFYDNSGSPRDVDFACWGPFEAPDQETFINNLCCTPSPYVFYTASQASHRPPNGDHSNGQTGGYPFGNLVDCSYNGAAIEWCFIPNGQVGDFYLVLITNYANVAGTMTFSNVTSTYAAGETDCSLLYAAAGSNSPVCQGDTLRLLCPTEDIGMSYLWEGPNGYISFEQNPVIDIATLDHNGIYKITVFTETDSSSTEILVEVFPYPDVILTPTPKYICPGYTFTLTVSDSAGNNYFIDWGENITDYEGMQAFNLTDEQYRIHVSDGRCAIDHDFTIEVKPEPIAAFRINAPEPFFVFKTLPFIDKSEGNVVKWLWNFGDNSISNLQNSGHYYGESGIYSVKLTSYTDFNCIDSIRQEIEILDIPEVYFPNAFTPYSSTNNEFKPIFYIPTRTDYSMDIFDRYGKLIFHSEDVDLGWNGYDNKGNPIKTTGTYVYVVNFRDTITNLQHRRKGSVTLIVTED